ncbi:TPA: hypothetical protein ACG3IZ_003397 [Clostridioides difficile]
MLRDTSNKLNELIKGKSYYNGHNRCIELDITFQRFYDIYYNFTSANYYLEKSKDIHINIDKWITNEEDILRIFLRGEYAKTSILLYNSVQDYVMQIIAAIFNLYKGDISNKYKFRKQCEEISYFKVVQRMNSEHYGFEKYNDILKIIKDYHYNKQIKEIRRVANNFKHNYNIRWSEMNEYERFINNIQDKITPEYKDINDVICLCSKSIPIIKNYVEDVYNYIADKFGLLKIY